MLFSFLCPTIGGTGRAGRWTLSGPPAPCPRPAARCSMSAAVASAAETFAEASDVAAPAAEAAAVTSAGAAALPEAAALASLALAFLGNDVAESLTVSDYAAVPSTSLAVPYVHSDLLSLAVSLSQLAAVVAVPSLGADVAAPSSVSSEDPSASTCLASYSIYLLCGFWLCSTTRHTCNVLLARIYMSVVLFNRPGP